MLFNSFDYLFLFLPIALIGYFVLSRHSTLALAWLTFASLAFYAWWNPAHLPLIIGSICFNFWLGQAIIRVKRQRRNLLWLGIAANLLFLGFFKYLHFASEIVTSLLGVSTTSAAIALPLGISFFTFTQIAYLVDTERGEVNETNPVHYALFVTFFPHLLAGPIIHHKEMMPQFANAATRRFDAESFARGLFLLALGLGKKVLIADPLGAIANAGYADIGALGFWDAWQTSLAYTFQIYFDFSGYTDMALGAALMFNIRLPINFNSPYRALDIQDFWRRWHMTLSRFLRDYLYIPLGGGKRGDLRVASNILVTFLLGGLWHGAGWTFIVWGAMHGVALVAFRFWKNAGMRMPNPAAWMLTFLFVHVSWILFRATSLGDAGKMLNKLVPDAASWQISPAFWTGLGQQASAGLVPTVVMLLIAAIFAALPRNSNALAEGFAGTVREGLASAALIALGVLSLGRVTQFLYFNF
ncbi:peptidoglycan O-acetyltransferase [soil metagenome]